MKHLKNCKSDQLVQSSPTPVLRIRGPGWFIGFLSTAQLIQMIKVHPMPASNNCKKIHSFMPGVQQQGNTQNTKDSGP